MTVKEILNLELVPVKVFKIVSIRDISRILDVGVAQDLLHRSLYLNCEADYVDERGLYENTIYITSNALPINISFEDHLDLDGFMGITKYIYSLLRNYSCNGMSEFGNCTISANIINEDNQIIPINFNFIKR